MRTRDGDGVRAMRLMWSSMAMARPIGGILRPRGAGGLRHIGDEAAGAEAAAQHLWQIDLCVVPSWNGSGPVGQGMSICVSSVTRARWMESASGCEGIIHAGSLAEIGGQRKGFAKEGVREIGRSVPQAHVVVPLSWPGPRRRATRS